MVCELTYRRCNSGWCMTGVLPSAWNTKITLHQSFGPGINYWKWNVIIYIHTCFRINYVIIFCQMVVSAIQGLGHPIPTLKPRPTMASVVGIPWLAAAPSKLRCFSAFLGSLPGVQHRVCTTTGSPLPSMLPFLLKLKLVLRWSSMLIRPRTKNQPKEEVFRNSDVPADIRIPENKKKKHKHFGADSPCA